MGSDNDNVMRRDLQHLAQVVEELKGEVKEWRQEERESKVGFEERIGELEKAGAREEVREEQREKDRERTTNKLGKLVLGMETISGDVRELKGDVRRAGLVGGGISGGALIAIVKVVQELIK